MKSFHHFFARPLWGCFLILATGLLFSFDIARAQGTASNLRIIKIDSSAFPEVRVQILALSPGGSTSAPPSRESLSLSENNRAVEYEIEEQEFGAEIGFILDAGMGLASGGATGATRLQEMKDAVVELTQDPQLMTGKDIFYVVAQEPGGPAVMVSPETAATQIPAILAQYNPQNPSQYAYPLMGVSSLLDWYAKENSSGNGRAQAIVVMAGNMLVDRKYTLAAVAAKANAMGIPVHTVQFRHSLGQQETLEQLADETGGQFFFYGYDGPTSLSGLKPLLTGIRTQYILTYRSPNSESGTRIVSVNFQYGNKPALSQYDITVEPPVGVIRSPGEDQTIRPQSYTPTEDPKATPVTGIVVTASVSWPDGHPRKIQSATLLVNGKPQSVLTAPSDELTFVWIPAKDFTPGPATLQIQIADELGLIGLSDQIVVRIEAASPFSFDLSLTNVLAILAVLLAAAAVVLVVVFRKQVAGTAQQAVGAASEFMQEVGETLRFKNRPTAAKATLVDLDGTSGTGKSDIELYGTTSIGRSQKNADLVFQANQPESPISRLHCTILEEDGAFFLRDDQSANGTYLNGIRLAPLERNPLKDGDEIRLANPEKKGVRLQFRSQGGGSASGGADTESTNRMSL